MSRAQTLVLCLFILHIFLGGLALAVASGNQKSFAMRWWGVGYLLYAAGLMTTQLRFVPPFFASSVGNCLIAIAPIPIAAAALSHVGRRFNSLAVGIALVVTCGVIIGNNLIASPYHLLVTLAAPSPIAIVLCGIATYFLVRTPPRDAKRASYALALFLGLSCVVWIVRIFGMVAILGSTNDRDRIDFVISLFVIAQLVLSVGATMTIFWIEVLQMQTALTDLALTDSLTGLANRRASVARFNEEIARASRSHSPFAMAVLDVDHFKHVNDQYGHLIGDRVLKLVAHTLRSLNRASDFVGRVGGEEFLVLVPGASPADALEFAERLRLAIAAARVPLAETEVGVTVSVGVASYPADGADWDAMFVAADQRLYLAKTAGRNRVVAALPDKPGTAEAKIKDDSLHAPPGLALGGT